MTPPQAITSVEALGSRLSVWVALYHPSYFNHKICVPSRREGEKDTDELRKGGFQANRCGFNFLFPTAFHSPCTHTLTPHWPLHLGTIWLTSGLQWGLSVSPSEGNTHHFTCKHTQLCCTDLNSDCGEGCRWKKTSTARQEQEQLNKMIYLASSL